MLNHDWVLSTWAPEHGLLSVSKSLEHSRLMRVHTVRWTITSPGCMARKHQYQKGASHDQISTSLVYAGIGGVALLRAVTAGQTVRELAVSYWPREYSTTRQT